MSQKRILKIIDNGKIAIQLYNSDIDLEGSMKVLRDGFIPYENISKAVGLSHPEAVQAHRDFLKLAQVFLNDGISLVARHLPTNQIVGLSCNKIYSRPEPGAPSFLKEFREKNCRTPESNSIISFIEFADGKSDLFNKFHIDSFLECVFLATLSDFRGKKIAYHLVEFTLELTREITAGKCPETIDKNIIGMKPKIVFAIWTSNYSARIGDKLGFKELEKIPFVDLKPHGVSYPERISPEHTHCVLAAVEI